MKTAISVPDDVFEEAERLIRATRRSRSELYTLALSEYLARHAPDRVTEAMDRVVSEVAEPVDESWPRRPGAPWRASNGDRAGRRLVG